MPRIALMSDVHTEFEPPRRPSAGWHELDAKRRRLPGHPTVGPLLDGTRAAGVDLVLMPGDIGVGLDGIRYADEVARYVGAPVATCLGNHEPYGGKSFHMLIALLGEAAAATSGRVAFLECWSVCLASISVLGCALWTDYELHGDPLGAMRAARRELSDHRAIVLGGRPFEPEDARRLHADSLDWLRAEASRLRKATPDLPLVAMTHHAPIREGNPARYRKGALAPAFASDLRADIRALSPSIWAFGHTHHDVDVMVGQTRVVSAQRGYVDLEPGALTFVPKILEL